MWNNGLFGLYLGVLGNYFTYFGGLGRCIWGLGFRAEGFCRVPF